MTSQAIDIDLAEVFDRVFDSYVINLARTPERMAGFLKRNEASGITFRRFEAVDGNVLNDEAAVELGLIKPNTVWPSRGSIGVAQSHRTLWERVIADRRPAIVFEDDACIRLDIRRALTAATSNLSDWDIILLGYNTDSLLEINVVADLDISGLFAVRYPTAAQLEAFSIAHSQVGLFRLRHAFGLCGYAISPAGAARLSQVVFPMDNRMLDFRATRKQFAAYSIDGMMNAHYRALAAFACFPPLVLAPNDKRRSTVTRGRT